MINKCDNMLLEGWCSLRAGILLIAASVVCTITPATLAGQGQSSLPPALRRTQPIPEEQGESEEVINIDTDLVLVDVTVTDAEGQPVRNLRPEDFKLYEDEVERPVAFFNVERRGSTRRPVAVVFALDTSGSMTTEEFARMREAVHIFSDKLAGSSSVIGVMSFGMDVRVLQPLTGDRRKLDQAFNRLARDKSGLSTHTYDAVDDAIRLLVRKAPRTRERRLMKRAVVVITDGFPVGDTVSPKTVIERANAADVSIYTVILPSYSRLLTASRSKAPLPTPLDVSGLAEKTGGKSVYTTESDYEPLLRTIAEEVTSTYVLAFYPPDENRKDGRFHSLRVEAPPGLYVRQSRPGYNGKSR